MAKVSFTIREARLPDDKPVILDFIMGLQHFEHAFEPNRRIDPAVAGEYCALIEKRVAERHGLIFIAEGEAHAPLGWAAAHESDDEIYVVSEQRTFGYVAELYVVESARGLGIGRALIAACEEWARGRKLMMMMIGVLNENGRAFQVYRDAGYRPYATMLKKPLP